jgi:sarcosine oxidase, subunit beta
MALTADVVIIGGGVTGTSIAFHLAARGMRDVIIVDKSSVASGEPDGAREPVDGFLMLAEGQMAHLQVVGAASELLGLAEVLHEPGHLAQREHGIMVQTGA